MSMGFLQKAQVAFEAGLAFPFLDLALHEGQVGGEGDGLVVVVPELIVGLTFLESDAFASDASTQVGEGFVEEVW